MVTGIPACLIIGNCISLIAVIFTVRSSWARDRWHIYMNQVAQCILVAIASFFLNSYAGTVSLLACAFRNYLSAKNLLTTKMTFFCLFLVVVPGLLVNNRGYVGLLVIGANILYTLGQYAAKSEPAIKVNIILNLMLWSIYDVFVIDIPSFCSDTAGLVVAIVSLFRPKIK